MNGTCSTQGQKVNAYILNGTDERCDVVEGEEDNFKRHLTIKK
jgi:hypothetical protein